MKIYADILIITNCILTLVYLQTTALMLHRRTGGVRLGAASLLGGLLSLLIAADGGSFQGAVVLTVIKLAGTALTLLLAVSFKDIWGYIRGLLIYLAVRAAFTGFILVFWEFSDSKLIFVRNYTVYFNISLLKLTLAVVSAYGVLSLCEVIKRRSGSRTAGYKARYTNGSYELTLPAVADTGNKLCDSFTGMPVVIFCCSDMYDHYGLEDPERSGRGGFRLIPCSTVNGSSLVAVTPKGRVTIIDEKGCEAQVRCYVGVTRSEGASKAIFDPVLLNKE